ncbi:beta-glucosidase family protein [Demequina flava]|uniref:beta-glucosidase family protein n=1 Tax=Demequina flava TaxID=1095025 RepID=UPI000AEF5C84|nr:glycoside hydrolase family 3 C-terminal domain-containing protein [Demequina flava]
MTTSSLSAPVSYATLAECRRAASALSVEDKVALLTGETMWRLRGIPQIGLRAVAFSDGPVGVRGLGETPGETSVLFPTPSAIAATWNPAIAFEIGQAFAREARDHGVDVVLAPQVNIQRTPVGGRHFECFSEDPFLTSAVGVAVVEGIQDQGVGACIKHYIANDSETDRTTYVSDVSMKVLREVYLAPFEEAVAAGAWAMMAAYNGVDDGTQSASMTEHGHLVTDVLKGELGFDGVMVSDWEANRTDVASANGGLDIVMPGPGGAWAQGLMAAVTDGRVDIATIDDKVARILLLAHRVGALDSEPAQVTHTKDLRALVRKAAAQSMVVLKADGDNAPWNRSAPTSIALLGANAEQPHVLGGGSSTVAPVHVVTPREGLEKRWPDAQILMECGGSTREHAPDLDFSYVVGGVASVHFVDRADAVVGSVELPEWDGWLGDVPDGAVAAELAFDVRLEAAGTHYVSIGTVGAHSIAIDGAVVSASESSVGVDCILDSSANNPRGVAYAVEVEEPRVASVRARLQVIDAEGYGIFVRAQLRHQLPSRTAQEELDAAVEAARSADLTVVVVGTNEECESEGWDRTTLSLPGQQDLLVDRVLDVAPDAVIVVNAGAPVLLPWLERAQTVLWAWFPGQEAGHSLADIFAGDVEPAGRLPWTLPGSQADVPVPHAIPVDGRIAYDDGVDVGYRAWERRGAQPAAPFGHGLGWTTWRYDSVGEPQVNASGDVEVDVTVTNTGRRDGTEIVQAYLQHVGGDSDRPVLWLGGFTNVDVAAGAQSTVTLRLARRRFETWDASAGWTRPPGPYRLQVGRSARNLQLEAVVEFAGDTEGGR